MPRIALACACLVGGCFFDARYRAGELRCSDGNCPSDLVCRADVCVDPRIDAAVDMMPDVMIDSRMAALTCSDPGLFPAAGGTTTGSTVTRTSTISAMCSGFVMNAPDAVYRVDVAAAGAHINLSITGSLNAYVIAPCAVSPATPMCLSNMMASSASPLTVTTAAGGPHFVVVDAAAAATTGAYTLTVSIN